MYILNRCKYIYIINICKVFNKLFSIEEHNKQEVVTAFSGLLEMSKRDKVNTKQEDLFEDIIVEKKKKIV